MIQIFNLEKQKAELATILGRAIRTSVKMENIFIPANKIQSICSIFSNILVFDTGHEIYQHQFIGSATGICFNNKYYLLTTYHQVASLNPEKIGTIILESNSYSSSSSFSSYKIDSLSNASDENDIGAFDYTLQAYRSSSFKRQFFTFSEHTCVSGTDRVTAFLTYGFPFKMQGYDIVDKNHVSLVTCALTCEPGEDPSDPALGMALTVRDMDFDPNGMSGGPVFAACLEGTEVILKIAGIVTRAGNGYIRFLKAQKILNFLNRI